MPQSAVEDRVAAAGAPQIIFDDERSLGLARASEEERLQHDRDWINSLGQRWRTHHGQDLRLRHDTGKALNERLGPPTKRLPRGEGVMRLLAEAAGVSESCLNRTRWFAFRFPNWDEFKAAGLGSWEKVCVRLVEISQQEKEDTAASTGSAKGTKPSKEVQVILRALKGVATAMPTKQVSVDDDAFEDIDTGLRKFRRALTKCTGLNVNISITPVTQNITS